MKDVSFLVVNWNTKDVTDACLRSLEEDCRGLDAETIVVDNGSTDGSMELIRSAHPGVRVIGNGENLGFAKANNIGIRESRGEFLFLVNSDAVVLPGCTRRLIDCLRAEPRLAMLGPAVLDRDRRPQQSCWEFASLGSTLKASIGLGQVDPCRAPLDNSRGYRSLRRHFLSGCALMVRRSAADEVGMFDERFFFYGEDMDWCRRMLDAGWLIGQIPSATVIHYGGASTLTDGSGHLVQAERALFQYLRKHGPWSVGIVRVVRLVHHLNRVLGTWLRTAVRRTERASAAAFRRRRRDVLRWLLDGEGVLHG